MGFAKLEKGFGWQILNKFNGDLIHQKAVEDSPPTSSSLYAQRSDMVHHALHHSAGQLSHCSLQLELHPPAREALQSPWLPAEKANFLNTLHGFLQAISPPSHNIPAHKHSSSHCRKTPRSYVELMLIFSLALDICHCKPCLLGVSSAQIKTVYMFEIKYSPHG